MYSQVRLIYGQLYIRQLITYVANLDRRDHILLTWQLDILAWLLVRPDCVYSERLIRFVMIRRFDRRTALDIPRDDVRRDSPHVSFPCCDGPRHHVPRACLAYVLFTWVQAADWLEEWHDRPCMPWMERQVYFRGKPSFSNQTAWDWILGPGNCPRHWGIGP